MASALDAGADRRGPCEPRAGGPDASAGRPAVRVAEPVRSERLAGDPGPFLALGMCSAAWLGRALPFLDDAARSADLCGDSLLHMDVRSDNLCVLGDRAILIDWNWACRGNAAFDLAAWLPSLHAEGGPAPETLMPEAGAFAALLAGYFCARAPRPPISLAPHVRPLQLAQARTALPWAARALGLPMPVDTAG
jgi:Ser/Thr protein kinase RdoA (MazF antagonist)